MGGVYTEQLNIRLRPSEKKALETWAAAQGTSLGELGRETLLQAVRISPREHRQLVLVAMGSEMNRLTMIGYYNEDPPSQEETEQAARSSAEAVVERWLTLRGVK